MIACLKYGMVFMYTYIFYLSLHYTLKCTWVKTAELLLEITFVGEEYCIIVFHGYEFTIFCKNI